MSVRDLARDLTTQRERRLYGYCVYCGAPCHGLACRGHRDLLLVDDHTYAMRLRGTGGNEPKGNR